MPAEETSPQLLLRASCSFEVYRKGVSASRARAEFWRNAPHLAGRGRIHPRSTASINREHQPSAGLPVHVPRTRRRSPQTHTPSRAARSATAVGSRSARGRGHSLRNRHRAPLFLSSALLSGKNSIISNNFANATCLEERKGVGGKERERGQTAMQHRPARQRESLLSTQHQNATEAPRSWQWEVRAGRRRSDLSGERSTLLRCGQRRTPVLPAGLGKGFPCSSAPTTSISFFFFSAIDAFQLFKEEPSISCLLPLIFHLLME